MQCFIKMENTVVPERNIDWWKPETFIKCLRQCFDALHFTLHWGWFTAIHQNFFMLQFAAKPLLEQVLNYSQLGFQDFQGLFNQITEKVFQQNAFENNLCKFSTPFCSGLEVLTCRYISVTHWWQRISEKHVHLEFLFVCHWTNTTLVIIIHVF